MDSNQTNLLIVILLRVRGFFFDMKIAVAVKPLESEN